MDSMFADIKTAIFLIDGNSQSYGEIDQLENESHSDKYESGNYDRTQKLDTKLCQPAAIEQPCMPEPKRFFAKQAYRRRAPYAVHPVHRDRADRVIYLEFIQKLCAEYHNCSAY